MPDPELVEQAKRRSFTAKYKLEILAKAKELSLPIGKGDVLVRKTAKLSFPEIGMRMVFGAQQKALMPALVLDGMRQRRTPRIAESVAEQVGGLWWGTTRPPFAEGPSHAVLAGRVLPRQRRRHLRKGTSGGPKRIRMDSAHPAPGLRCQRKCRPRRPVRPPRA